MEFKELTTSKFNAARDKRWFGLQAVAATVSGEVAIAFQSGRRCEQSCRARSLEDVDPSTNHVPSQRLSWSVLRMFAERPTVNDIARICLGRKRRELFGESDKAEFRNDVYVCASGTVRSDPRRVGSGGAEDGALSESVCAECVAWVYPAQRMNTSAT